MTFVLKFSFYGFKVQVQSLDALPSDSLNQDFAHFKIDDFPKADLLIRQEKACQVIPKKGLKLGTTKMCEVRQISLSLRHLIYHKQNVLVAIHDRKTHREIVIHTENQDLFSEIASVAILSASGEHLEVQGIMRLHAFSCLYRDQSYIFWGPRRAGKSTLAMLFSHIENLSIYSDEITLIDLKKKSLLPFPIRMTLNQESCRLLAATPSRQPKRELLDQKYFFDLQPHLKAPPRSADHFYILGTFTGEGALAKVGPLQKYRFLARSLLESA